MNIDKTSDINSLLRGICLASEFFTRPMDKVWFAKTGSARRWEIEVGEAVEMAYPGTLTYQWTLLRKPAGSAGRIEGGQLLGANKPGVYLINVEIGGGWSRQLELCAFTREQMFGASPRATDEQRLNARSWLHQPGRTTEEVIARLER
jgi:hypothetical protein